MAQTVVVGGERFFFNGKDYFRNSRGQLLHRVLWVRAHGPIPRGAVVHHINHDKLDNRLENLELMSKRDHVRHHGRVGYAAWTPEQHVEAGRRSWIGREPKQRVCERCGAEYATRASYSRWCSIKCSVAARYHGQTRPRVAAAGEGLQPRS